MLFRSAKAKLDPELTTRLCPRCRERVSTASRFCQKCGSSIDTSELVVEEKRETADRLLNILLDDLEVRSLIAKKLSELGNEQFHATTEKLREKRS